MSDPAAPLPEPVQYAAKARAERQLCLLDELAEIGLQAARTVGRDAETGASATEVALAYARVSRAVRLTILLQNELTQEHEASEAKARAAAEEAEELEADIRRVRVSGVVQRIARERHDSDSAEVERLTAEADERLDDMDLYGDLLDSPLSEIVARICRDLNLEPDWSELAQELWATEEIASGEPGWPLAAAVAAQSLAAEGGGRLGPRPPIPIALLQTG